MPRSPIHRIAMISGLCSLMAWPTQKTVAASVPSSFWYQVERVVLVCENAEGDGPVPISEICGLVARELEQRQSRPVIVSQRIEGIDLDTDLLLRLSAQIATSPGRRPEATIRMRAVRTDFGSGRGVRHSAAVVRLDRKGHVVNADDVVVALLGMLFAATPRD